ncbi:Uncharacterized protein M6B38_219815 [Iris pallida]|uniref:Uncharacterized protein n=1 Tax=Iris pallida TaxID=29817 RepID=A0AAX6DXY3_IRIPA|nr:Uncharacterized protein M6B38_219815 [Iris pallida]
MSTKKGGRRALSRLLDSHIKNLEETFQMLDTPAESSLEKVDWAQVTKLGDEISKQATATGMLWNGEARELKELEESLGAYFNLLHGFLLSCHGSTVCSGPTLHAYIHTSAKQIMDSSLSLLREAVSSYGKPHSSKNLTITQLAGSVWEACTALKKTPTTNCNAVGRAITQVAVSVKDVLREMRELKPAAIAASSTSEPDANPEDFNNESSDDDLGDDLSPEEMMVAQLILDVTSNSLEALKEVIRFVSGLIKSSKLDSKDFIESLERLLSYCREIGSEVNDLGACVYPPQEISGMSAAAKKIGHGVGEIRKEVESVGSSKERLFMAFEQLESSLGRLETGLAVNSVPEMDKLVL